MTHCKRSEGQMKTVFYVGEQDFLFNTLKISFEDKNLTLFLADDIFNLDYFISDLRPAACLCDYKSMSQNFAPEQIELFLEKLKNEKILPIIIDNEEGAFSKNYSNWNIKSYKRPINPIDFLLEILHDL